MKYTKEYLKQAVLEAAKKSDKPLRGKDFDPKLFRAIRLRYGWCNFLVELGLPTIKVWSGNVEQFKTEAARLYLEEKLTLAKVGERLGCSHTSVQKWLRELCVPIRTVSDYDMVHWDRGPVRTITRKGYVNIRFPGHKPNQGQPEHRYIMEQHLGRKLEKDEVVHHINAVKTDNRVENLMVIKQNQHKTGKDLNYHQHYINRIRELEKENEHLKSLLGKG